MANQERGSSVDKHEIEGHTVEIRRTDDREELWIDGRRRRFFRTPDGYTLNDDAYVKPFKSLYDATASYLNKLAQQTRRKD